LPGRESSTVRLRDAIDWGRLSPLRLQAKAVADGVYAGSHKSLRRGAGIEFGGHRNYVPGDELRFLDRHARMRHGLLLIREFETETDRALRLVVDASASMRFASDGAPGPKYAYAALLAAALGRIALGRGDRVALDFAGGNQTVPLPSTGGRDAFERLVGHLETAVPDGELDRERLETALSATIRFARRGSAVVFLSDLLDLPEEAPDLLAGLSAAGRAVVVVQVLDPVELSFPFRGPLSLAALEGGERVETDGGSARAGYLEALAALAKLWESRLVGRGGHFVQVGSDQDAVEAVRGILGALARAGDGSRGRA
jgi:uncharacterized protein (DUF58 family)